MDVCSGRETTVTAPMTILSLMEGENAIWMVVLLSPALIVFAVHLLCLGLWQRIATRRVRRHLDKAFLRGDVASLQEAAGETTEAARDWPGRELWTLQQAAEIMRHRVEHSV